ncbi:hypothetical protein F53441_442 [Fusarium austroafricanum]|uniref:FAD linked oxidase N-terminal domain-containing protein n=1 Tax=Fusarium austroafricanum TaxID=2364996 RepID=A0A8H4PEL5_9HYPO|nr:hypothetical protein F53441_442 [Fusarium austroafricanum]
MKCYSLLIPAFLGVVTSASESRFEPSNFNITQALLDQGVDVSELPVSSVDAKRSDTGCAATCASLKILYGDAAIETRKEKAFDEFTSSYWSSNQAEVNPYCIFEPHRPSQISILVLLARLTKCSFTAKSGGHAAFAGASSVEGGITISFANLKEVSLSRDKKIASIEPGNIWGPVYEKLAKSDVTVVGGRLYNIGVGGLTTGGGISFFSNIPPGLREIYYVITTKVNHDILVFARDYFYTTVPTVAGIPGIIPVFVVQGITTPQIKQMQKNGGNAMGMSPDNGPLLIFQLCAMWDNKSDDEAVYRWMSDILETVTKEAKARAVKNNYVYMNYASQFQDVIASYGSSNKAKLKSIAKKHDPQQVFQKLQPGYFKLDRAPILNSGYFSH